MPRARTQSGSASCADDRERVGDRDPGHAGDDHRRHRDPDVRRERHHRGGRPPAAPCRASTSWSRVAAPRAGAAATAPRRSRPAPMRGQQQREGAGAAAVAGRAPPAAAAPAARSSAGRTTQMRSSTARMRGDCAHVLHADAHRADEALARQRRLGLLLALPAAGSTKPRPPTAPQLSANTYSLPALAISAPATSGPTMRETFIATPLSAERRRQLRARHQLGHDGREHRPAHRQADAVGEDEHQQQRRGRCRSSDDDRAEHGGVTATQNCVTMK